MTIRQTAKTNGFLTIIFISIFSFFTLTSCKKTNDEKIDQNKILIVATTTMLADLLENLVDEKFTVKGLMAPTVDPHLYNPKVTDSLLLNQAKAIFYSGLHLEGKMTSNFADRQEKGEKVFSVGDSLPENLLYYVNDGEQNKSEQIADPHIWGDVSIWIECVKICENNLAQTFPEHAETFKTNAEKYISKLEKLNNWVVAKIASLPAEKRILISSHDAFSYFGRAYGFQVIGIQGISTVSEASMNDIISTIDLVKTKDINAIFIETTTSPKAIKKVVKDANIKIGGKLFSDAMGEKGVTETIDGESYDVGTYIGMIKHNVNTIINALK